MAPETKTILILGGSYGGISTAHYTFKHIIPALPSPDSYQVVIVSSSREVMCRPAAPRALIEDSYFDQSKLFVSLEAQFKPYGERFQFIHGRAKWLDHERRVVVVDRLDADTEIELEYHALVIATGSSTPSPLFSLNSAGKPELTAQWKSFRGSLPSAKRIVIAGGGPTGIETAGELGEHLNGKAGWFSSRSAAPKVRIVVVTAGSEILPQLRPAIARTAEGYLAKLGVEIIKNVKVEDVAPVEAGKEEQLTAKTVVKLSNGETLQADLYIPAYGTTPNTTFLDGSLKSADGRVFTNPQTLRVDKAGSRVYAVGDVSDYARPAIHILMEAIPVLCANLKRDLLVEAEVPVPGDDRLFKADETETHLVPIGKGKGVGAAKGYRMPSFLVWLIKGRDYWLGMAGGIWAGKPWAKET
jgi:NADH dehydrogenase FAD-containing subunit